MWKVGDKNMNFEGQMTGYGPVNTEVPSVEKRNFLNITSRSKSDKPFLDEPSGKGENSFVMSNTISDVVPSFYRGKFGDNLQDVSGAMISQHQLYMATTQQGVMFTEKDVQFEETNTMLSRSGDYLFRDPINFSTSLQTEGVTLQKPGLNNSQSTFYRTEPSHQSHTSVGKYPQLPNSQHLMYGLSSQADAGKFLSYASEDAVSREKVPMNFNPSGVINPTMRNFPSLKNVSFHPVSASQGSVNSSEFCQPGMYSTELGNTEAKFDGRNFSGNVCYIGTPVESVKDGYNVGMSGLPNSTFNITSPPQNSAVMERNQAGSQYRPKTEGQSPYYQSGNAGASSGANNQEKNESGKWEKASDCKTTLLDYSRMNGSSNEAQASKKMDDSDGRNGNNSSKVEALQNIGISVNKSAAPHEKRPSLSMDSTSKLPSIKVAPRITEKLWDGTLQLNTSTVVSAVAVFKSGEKVSEVNWSKFVEVKGKVRLEAFEKFVQELPRSRTRSLMVISIHWKVGSSETGLMGMKEVAKGYKEGQRVGFAQLSPGIDLYVCPRSDAIITILAKYGFFKGMAAVEEDQDSLIGCVIWRRNHSSSDFASKKSDKNEFPLLEQPLDSPESGSPNNEDQNSLVTKTVDSGSNQVTPGLKVPVGTSSSVNPLRPETENADDIQNVRSTNISINVTSNNNTTAPVLTPLSTHISSITAQLPISVQDTPAETPSTLPMHISSITPQLSMCVQIDTPAGDAMKFTSPTITPFIHCEAQKNPQAGIFEPSPQLVSGASQKLQDNYQRSADKNDDDDLPEFDFGNAYGVLLLPKNRLPSYSNIPCSLEPPHKQLLPVQINESPSVIRSLELPSVRPLPPNDRLRGPHAQSYFVLMHPNQNVLKEVGVATPGPKLSAKIIETSSSLAGSGINKNSGNPISRSFFAPEIVETLGPASKSVASEEQNSASQAAKSSFVQKRPIWDDDDMPEWCPPSVDNRQLPPMPVLSPPPPPLQPMSFTAPSPFWAPPSVTTPSWASNPPPPQPPFRSHYDQNISHQHQSGILPPRPLDGNHKTPVEIRPATRFGRSDWRASPESYPSQSKRQRRVSGWDVKPWEVKPDP